MELWDVYNANREKNIGLSETHLQAEEVQAVKWATRKEIKGMIAEGVFIPYYPSLIDLIFDARRRYGAHGKSGD